MDRERVVKSGWTVLPRKDRSSVLVADAVDNADGLQRSDVGRGERS